MKRLIIFCLGMCLSLFFVAATLRAEEECYKTPKIDVTQFVFQKQIIPITTGCKEGYYITEITQSPETDPKSNGQYVIVSQIKCCRPIGTPPPDK